MPSPFPGMDPYLEARWHDFHERFLPYAAAHLARQVLPRYIVLIDENVYVHDIPRDDRRLLGRPDLSVTRGEGAAPRAAAGVLEAPAQVLLPEQDVESLSYLKVVDRDGETVVAVIELLSPTNKRPGDDRVQYLAKRSAVRQSEAHLVEIDLLRGGLPMPAEGRPECVFSVLVSRAGQRPRADFWPFGLRDPLPVVPIPLRDGDPDARLDLRAVLDRIHDEAGYVYYLYGDDPDPPLTGDDLAWARQFVPTTGPESSP
jgi:hypothetical protein